MQLELYIHIYVDVNKINSVERTYTRCAFVNGNCELDMSRINRIKSHLVGVGLERVASWHVSRFLYENRGFLYVTTNRWNELCANEWFIKANYIACIALSRHISVGFAVRYLL